MSFKRKVKYIGLGEYPNIHVINKYKTQLPDNIPEEEKKEWYYYFGTSKGIKRRRVFKNGKE